MKFDSVRLARNPRIHSKDDGNIVLLSLGVLGLLMGLLAVAVDVGHANARHVAVTAASERIALAAASAVDSRFEATSASPGTRLQLARTAALAEIRKATAIEVSDWTGLRVSEVRVALTSVQLKTCAPVRLPLSWRSVGAGSRRVCARAAAATAISWTQYP